MQDDIMIILKMGGSIITDKGRPLTPKRKTIDGMADALADLGEPLVIVHGGGSFGHHWSVKYDMHTRPERHDARGVATVKNSMVELNKIILDSLLRCGMSPYCLPPAGFVRGGRAAPAGIREAGDIAESGMTPVTYGDALWHGRGASYILSGDRIMGMMARTLKPRLCIFATDVDGLYRDPESKSLIDVVDGQSFRTSDNGMDVTGGMARKVQEATRISGMGHDVFFVNGHDPGRIADAVKRKKFQGTLFRGR